MEENALPEYVIEAIIRILIKERSKDLSQEDIYWEIAEVLENYGIRMQAEEAYKIAKREFPSTFNNL